MLCQSQNFGREVWARTEHRVVTLPAPQVTLVPARSRHLLLTLVHPGRAPERGRLADSSIAAGLRVRHLAGVEVSRLTPVEKDLQEGVILGLI